MSSHPTLGLDEHQRRSLIELISSGQQLPEHYRSLLFPKALQEEKSESDTASPLTSVNSDVSSPPAPLHLIETLLPIDKAPVECPQETCPPPPSPWKNQLIWGDNLLVLESLSRGHLRAEIERIGGLKLVYLDPPYAVGSHFLVNTPIHTDHAEGEGGPSLHSNLALREVAYRDRWSRGRMEYIDHLRVRLKLVYELMADDGSLFLQCDWRVTHHVRLLLEEIFGAENYINEIIWGYATGGGSKRFFSRKHDTIHYLRKGPKFQFYPNETRQQRTEKSKKRAKHPRNARISAHSETKLPTDVWSDLNALNPMALERVHYPTQKPEQLIERVVKVASKAGDLIADFYGGSGTLAVVAERLGRRWICVDDGRRAHLITRRRLIGSPTSSEESQHNPLKHPLDVRTIGSADQVHPLGAYGATRLCSPPHSEPPWRERWSTQVIKAYGAEIESHEDGALYGVMGEDSNDRREVHYVSVTPWDRPATLSDLKSALGRASLLEGRPAEVLLLAASITDELRAYVAAYHPQSTSIRDARVWPASVHLKQIPSDVLDIDDGETLPFYPFSMLCASCSSDRTSKGPTVTITLTDLLSLGHLSRDLFNRGQRLDDTSCVTLSGSSLIEEWSVEWGESGESERSSSIQKTRRAFRVARSAQGALSLKTPPLDLPLSVTAVRVQVIDSFGLYTTMTLTIPEIP